ncbi:EAL domain-containing protein [Neobacillus niacini]|uniref:putative bifunctional diguanylate cyclase/phosphodiesterase n=1 Tax=Neobacillus niacini TaxID=86668 RepID=UPI002FFEF28D
MFGIKFYLRQLNSEILLLFILFGLTIFSTFYNVTFVYGITFTYASIFIFLLFRLFGLPFALLAIFITLLIPPFDFMNLFYKVILLLEILFVGTYFHVKKRAKMFYVDLFFWLTVGLITTFLASKTSFAGDALYFQMFKGILNGLFNVLLADMLLAYFPFYKLMKANKLNKNNVSVHQFLSHLTILSIMLPFFLSVLIKTVNAHENYTNQAYKQAELVVHQIKTEIHLLIKNNQNEPSSLKDTSTINELLDKHTSMQFSIMITDVKNKIIGSNAETISNRKEEYFNWIDRYEINNTMKHFYELLPKDNINVLPLIRWRSGLLVYEDTIDTLPIKIFILYPISQYQDQVFRDFLIHLKLSIFFSVFIIIFVQLISRLFMKNIQRLIIVTTDLPQKLLNLEKVDFPQSNIAELGSLTQNLQKMAQKLKELFQESIEMNKLLIDQTNKLKVSEDKLHQLAYYDSLTSLPNRLYFQCYVKDLINHIQSECMAIIFIDLNQFKQVNDTLGHDAGDHFLQLTANRLNTLANRKLKVFRLGGDEFVIVQVVNRRDEVALSIEKIQKEFTDPFRVNEQVLYNTLSIGISLYPEDGRDLDTLVKCADIAMYVSKEKGGNAAHFFNETMKDKFQERLVIENCLRSAIDEGGFELFYQPKFQFGQVSSMEALLRLNDPNYGHLSPDSFIPIAEETGLISKIDEWVLLEACRQNKRWQEESLGNVPISVNISAINLQQNFLIPLVERALVESGLSPEYLKLEITENVFIKNPNQVVEVINQLRSLGVHISIDDFGKGYSSFIHLLQLPIDEIKIDSHFIKEIHQDEKKSLIVKSILDIAHGLRLNVVAEGVETEAEKDFLIHMKCDEIQGYFYSRPLNKIGMANLLREREINQNQISNALASSNFQ